MSRIAIIGAGVGGLAAAVKLSALGHDVEVFESSAFVGGKCRTEEFNGYRFDVGPSLFTLPAVYRDLFLKSGASLEEELTLIALNPAFEYRFADGTKLNYYASRSDLMQSIADSFGANAASDWQRLIDRGSEMWRVAREPFIQSPIASFWSMIRRSGFWRDARIIAPHRTLRGIGRSIVSEPHLQMIIDRYATYTGSDPRKAPAALLTIPYIEHTFGAWHISGGVGTLSEVLAARARSLGARINLSTEVTTIETHDGAVTGIRLGNGTLCEADIVISNADATHTFKSLIDVPRESARLAKESASLSGFVLLLGLRGRTPGLGHNTVLFPTDYNADFDALFGDAFVEDYKNKIIDQIEARGFLVRERIEVCEVRTPAHLERESRAPGGGIYGKAGNSRTAALSRTKNTTKIRGLYSVGGSVHPGGGLPMVGIGAEIVCRAIGPAN